MSHKKGNTNKRQNKRTYNDSNNNKHDEGNNHFQNKKQKLNERIDDSKQDIFSLIKCNKPRNWTISVALPGSIMDTAKTPQLQTYLASQIARIVAIFGVDEVIVFPENGKVMKEEKFKSDPNLFLLRLLKFVETPQYLRRLLFPRHNDLRNVGLCKPLRTPHHLAKNEICPFREGIVLKKTISNHNYHNFKNEKTNNQIQNERKNKNQRKLPNFLQKKEEDQLETDKQVSLVNIGMDRLCAIDRILDENTRVTVHLDNYNNDNYNKSYYSGKVVESSIPMKTMGMYWGYKVRFAMNIKQVITECSFDGSGYDLIIGTSDKGSNIFDDLYGNNEKEEDKEKTEKFEHLLIVFGGPNGLEKCLEKPELLFDKYINVCPYQSTRTIRTEEAILMTLSVLQPFIQRNYE